MSERRLTTAGVELVRSGAVQPSAVLREFVLPSGWDVPRSLPAGAWADAGVETYESSRLALCPGTSAATGTGLVNRLPPAAQALLRGKERRTFNNVFEVLEQSVAPPVECFVVTIEETRALRQILSDWGLPSIAGTDERYENCGLAANVVEAKTICGGLESSGDQPLGFYVPVEGVGKPVELVTISVDPILPHGAWINLPG